MRISDWSSDVCSSDLEERPAFTGAHQMEAAGYEPPETVGIAEAEETDRLHLRLVLDIDPLHRPHVERPAVAVDERADDAALVEEVHLLRRCVEVVDFARLLVVGCENLAHREEERGVGKECVSNG